MKKLTKLESIRGFSAIYVVLGHTLLHNPLINSNVAFFFKFGQEAVIVFFLLSGFVIQYVFHYSRDKTFLTYFKKRFFRIYIPLIVVFLANYMILCVETKSLYKFSLSSLAGNILMLQDTAFAKPNVICSPFLGNIPLWSLSYEWWFYMLFFPIRRIFEKRSSYVVYFISILAALTYLFYPNFINRLIMYLLIWWAGVELAIVYINNNKILFEDIKKIFLVLVLCIAILSINVQLNYKIIKEQLDINGTLGESPLLELRHFIFALIAIVLAIVWRRRNWSYFSKTIGLFEFAAPISFGLYISHYFLLSKAKYLDGLIPNPLLRYLVYVVICFLFAYVLERIIYIRLNNFLYYRKNSSKQANIFLKRQLS